MLCLVQAPDCADRDDTVLRAAGKFEQAKESLKIRFGCSHSFFALLYTYKHWQYKPTKWPEFVIPKFVQEQQNAIRRRHGLHPDCCWISILFCFGRILLRQGLSQRKSSHEETVRDC